ncbi:hypothetical protein [Desulfosporosinus sp. FKB]|uniref:hypothetical protein n=1 Tax=Desulfosporosinus sp. FKB TaxID=1969835 RepID=UPI000B4A2EE9|nr:hypothetical protein [Desulfosporosinus sp. FKB]
MPVMTNIQKGLIRDQAILDTITFCKVMDTNQIAELFFRFPSGLRKCQARMKILVDKRLVKKTRLSLDTATIYYRKKLPDHVPHALGVTWCYVWMKRQYGENLLTFELEQLKEFGDILQADALCSVKISITGEIRWFCIEFETGLNRNRFDKVEKYVSLYNREGIPGSPLLKRLNNPQRFPKIIVVTDSVRRAQQIKEFIANANTKVKFEVHLLSAIKEERSDNLCRL